ncbi:DUF3857 domain-containing protein [Flavobacteriaceae bacterium S0825]|uniref:DUF3857 domain-containing protein n=1 Tax=Gaetbulibacter sp. S0825 TaxID=2720084 RepID=UPI00142FF78C|nr:DUF3857 domain-containing protein [Gaetbulibacter sp. S0825]MCK0109196.1 DUF3857 domain-containing protein [Flavobacteriaceae bacterium S0825]NIX64831.1 DUF3857 domain-containing protein [Gaetbulibacter sp. S0825]
MKQILNLFSLLFIFQLNAQSNFNSSNIEVTTGDLQTNVYAKDTTANALVIYEKGNSYVHKETYKLITEIEKKVKILNKDGENESTVEIYLYNSDDKRREEKVTKIVAKTHNLENGQIRETPIRNSEVFREVYNKNYTIVKFTLPKISSGSVITYSYRLESPFMFNYKEWEFQDDIPKLYSQYNTSIPGNYEYGIKLVGVLKLDINESTIEKKCLSLNPNASGIALTNTGTADCTNSIYVMKNIPAFIEEDYMTSSKNYLSRIDYELKKTTSFNGVVERFTKTWKDVDKELKSHPAIGKQFNRESHVKGLLGTSISQEKDKLTKAKNIYNFVQENYTWNEKYLKFTDASIKDIVKNKSGNVSQINLLLHNLLTANNIESTPVLLSTRENGFATTLYPVLSDFNYLITQVTIDDVPYLLDATDEYLSFGQLPFRCLNDYGRLLTLKKGSKWIDIVSISSSLIQYQVDLKFNENNILNGTINSRYSNYFALSKKKDYFPNPKRYLEDFENDHVEMEVIEHKVKNESINNDKFEESFQIEYPDLETTSETLYLDPFIDKFISTNPFKLQDRTYPIDFGYRMAYMYNFQLDLGDKYELSEIPQSKKMTLPENAGDYTFAISTDGNIVTMSLKINLKKTRYSVGYYISLKQFMSNIVNTQTKTLLALKKKQ